MTSKSLPHIDGNGPGERLRALRAAVTGRIVFTTSFGIEDQAITHFIAEQGLGIDIVTLDTGRLFPETRDLWQATEARYGLRIDAVRPDPVALDSYVAASGLNGFYESVEKRINCCSIRKVEPLSRALAGAEAWVTGLRADQSAARGSVELAAWDEAHGLVKVAPLFDWSRERIKSFVEGAAVPISALHARGYPSIGCEPCTRAIRPGEPERAGRWWWEQDDKKECGLHIGEPGREAA